MRAHNAWWKWTTKTCSWNAFQSYSVRAIACVYRVVCKRQFIAPDWKDTSVWTSEIQQKEVKYNNTSSAHHSMHMKQAKNCTEMKTSNFIRSKSMQRRAIYTYYYWTLNSPPFLQPICSRFSNETQIMCIRKQYFKWMWNYSTVQIHFDILWVQNFFLFLLHFIPWSCAKWTCWSGYGPIIDGFGHWSSQRLDLIMSSRL